MIVLCFELLKANNCKKWILPLPLTVGAICLSGKNNRRIYFNKIILKLCNKKEGNFGITLHYATAVENIVKVSLHCAIKPHFVTFSNVFSNNTLSITL